MTNILFVCLGNICRSAAAQTIMQKLVDEAGLRDDFRLDSAGLIDYHEGEPADSRMRAHAAKRGLRITHLSRPVRATDFFDFDLIVGMDESNIDGLRRLSPTPETDRKIRRMTDFCTAHPDDHVPDPYYGGAQGFEHVLDLLDDACRGLLATLSRGA